MKKFLLLFKNQLLWAIVQTLDTQKHREGASTIKSLDRGAKSITGLAEQSRFLIPINSC